jgi:hypothetical protein
VNRSRRLVTIALAAVILLAVGCVEPVGPARTEEDYALKASGTAAAVLSAMGTASLVVDGVAADDLFAPYVAVMLSESEVAAAGAQSTFEGIQPPPGRASAVLRTRLGDLVDRCVDRLAELRIAARRGDLAVVAEQGDALDRLTREFEQLDEGLP